MPRDGSGVMTKSQPSFVAGTTITSASVNADFDDLITDANNARPITAGGTAATTPIGAFDKLSAAGADVASAATLNLDTATGPIINVTGTVTVTAVTLGAGKTRIAKATGAFQLTASATLVVNKSTSVNYTTGAGDLLIVTGEAGLVRVWVVPVPAAAASIATVVSAATTLIGAALSSEVNITGTVTITAFDTVAAGTVREGYFSGALTLTHNGTSLILPGGANITTAANDRFKAMSLGGGNWIVLWYTRAANSVLPAVAPGGLFGCVLSNDGGTPATVLDISAGTVTDSTNTYSMTIGAMTKTIASTWAVGTGNGGLDTGAAANNTYHIFVIKRLDTGVTDVLFSLSATAPTMPANYTIFRRIGSIPRLAGAWAVFVQNGDDFQLTTAVVDINGANNPGAAAVTATLSVPTGIVVTAWMAANLADVSATPSDLWISSLDSADQAPSTGGIALVSNATTGGAPRLAGWGNVKTNTSAQIRYRLSFSSASVTLWLVTRGWTDLRNRT